MTPGLGYHEDPVDKNDWDIDKMGLASAPSASAGHSLMEFEGEIYNQGPTSSCVGQTIAGAIHNVENQAAARGVDITPAKPAVLSIYYNSRVQHDGRDVSDTGTYLRTATSALFKLGCPNDSEWPFSTSRARVNKRPRMGATMRGMGRRGGEYYRILDAGDGRITAIKAALHAGHPVCFGTRVTNSFLNSDGSDIIDAPEAGVTFAGGHAMVIVAYKDTEPAGTLFKVRNSWGAGWRDGGYAWLTEEYIRWFQSNDFQVIVGWDLIKESA